MIKRIRSLYFRIYIRLAERRYKRLKYIFQRGKSRTLIVSFSGFSGNGPARYNYINTLKGVNANRLYILDDFGYKKQGSYYLGENGNWFVPEMVIELINKLKAENDLERVVMIGSSKGGTASLYYAIKLKADFCVIGAPQYYCGDYLSIDKHLPILKGIMGNTEDSSVQKLNRLISDCICGAISPKPDVYIHFSPKEHTYQEHISDLILDLNKYGFRVFEDCEYEYTDHSEVARYFPKYLLKVIGAK